MRTMVNLLPVAFRREQLARKRATQWGIVICLVFVGSWISHWAAVSEQRALAEQLEVLSRQHRPTQKMLVQLMAMRERLKTLQHEEAVARELEYQPNPLALLGVISQTAQKANGRLRVTRLELTDFQRTEKVAEAATGKGRPGAESLSVTVSGVSLDNPAVADLLDSLQNSGLFGQVDLVSMKEREDGSTTLRDFEVRCEL